MVRSAGAGAAWGENGRKVSKKMETDRWGPPIGEAGRCVRTDRNDKCDRSDRAKRKRATWKEKKWAKREDSARNGFLDFQMVFYLQKRQN